MTTLQEEPPAAINRPRVRQALGGYVRNAIRSVWMYRADLVISVVSIVIQVWLLKVVWQTVYGGA